MKLTLSEWPRIFLASRPCHLPGTFTSARSNFQAGLYKISRSCTAAQKEEVKLPAKGENTFPTASNHFFNIPDASTLTGDFSPTYVQGSVKALEAAEAARKEEAKRAEERERRKALLDKRREEKLKDLAAGAAQVSPIFCLSSQASLYDLQVVIRSVRPLAATAGVELPLSMTPISLEMVLKWAWTPRGRLLGFGVLVVKHPSSSDPTGKGPSKVLIKSSRRFVHTSHKRSPPRRPL
jgi:hypothetical protein